MTKLKVGQGGESMNHFQIHLSDDQKVLHQKAVALSQAFRKCEYELIEVLCEVDKVKLFRHLGYASLFRYAVDELKLSESQAYSFITVARKSMKVQPLAQTLKNGTLTVSKASRIASSLTSENAANLISYAKTHTSREIDLEVSKINPKEAKRQSVRLESNKSVRLAVSLSSDTYEKIKRVQDLLAQKGKSTDLASTIDSLLDEYLMRNDPVVKAKRVLSKQKKGRINSKGSSEYADRNKESTTSHNRTNNIGPTNNIEPDAKLNQMTLSKQSESLNSEPESNSQAKKGVDMITMTDAKTLPSQSEPIGIQIDLRKAVLLDPKMSQLGKPTSNTLPKQSDWVKPKPNNYMSTRGDCGAAALRTEQGFINVKPKGTSSHTSKPKREPIPAHVKHQVYLKHKGRCSFVDARGERCVNSRYLHLHHIQSVSLGGGNDPENLSLLCASHHELVHQLSFPLEGQVSWLRSTVKEYRVS